MVTSMAFAISTTSVTASPGATLEPTYVRANTRVMLTVVVTNETSDNIDNVRIIAPSGSDFTQAIGGASAAENLKLAGDNMENAAAPLDRAGDNLKLAGENKEAAGQAVIDAAAQLSIAVDKIVILGWDNIPNLMDQATTYLDYAGDNMAAASENFTAIAASLALAASNLDSAAGTPGLTALWYYNILAAENLDNAAAWLGNVDDAILAGSLRNAGDNLVMAGSYLENAGKTGGLVDNNVALGTAIQTAGSKLQVAGNNLIDAAKYENYAGINLALVKNYLLSAGSLIRLADANLVAAGDNLENAALQIGYAAENMKAIDDNILQAGDNLSQAVTYLANAATQLGTALGGDGLENAMEHENAAADNLHVGDVDLGTAGDQLIEAAPDLSAAASTMLSTANALAPVTWTMSEPTATSINFNAILDNVITPGSSETFVFLWTTPDPGIENTYTITIASNKKGGGDAHWIVQDEITLTVDGAVPTLTIVVTQVGVKDKDGAPVSNVVGTVLDDAKATITITASEALQSIGTVTVENSGNDENFLPPITLTTTDDIVYTGTFTVGVWDDNDVVVKVASAKDLAGLENTNMENTVTVDTRAPIIIDNGLAGLISGMSTNVTQAGTGENFLYVDNKVAQSIIINVEDNYIGSTDNDVWVISVTVVEALATRSAVVENLWVVDPLTLSEGLTSLLTVTATDRTGNTVSENVVENIFIDATAPTIAFDTIAGKTWASGVRINDNTPEIKVTVKDPGYSASGLGIARENLVVRVDNDDNFPNGSPYAAWGTLENKDAWDFGLAGVFENLIDNAGVGLLEGTYWVTVAASDNLAHDGEENQYDALSFTIDISPPLAPTLDVTVSMDIDTPKVLKTTSRTITGTAEVGATINVYGTVDTTETVLGTATVGSDGRWAVAITLTAGKTTKIEVSATDVAGNEGSRRIYGYLLVDATAPTVSITAPESGISTDASSITVEATVTKDTWETYAELTVRIDATSLMAPISATNALSTDGKLARAVGLVEGTNTISVSAQDAAGNWSTLDTVTVTRTVTPWGIYAIIVVIIALILAAIAIFQKR